MSKEFRTTVEQVPLVLLRSNGQSFVIGTPEGLEANKGHRGAVFGYARLFFPSLDYDSLRLEAFLPGRGWVNLVDSSIESTAEETEDLIWQNGAVCSDVPDTPKRAAERPMLLYVKALTGKRMTLAVMPTDTTRSPPHLGKKRLETEYTCADYGLKDRDEIHLVLTLRGGKPVSCLFPPVPLPEVQVFLTLSPAWNFSALYPVVEVVKEKNNDSTVFWRVSADSSGKLLSLLPFSTAPPPPTPRLDASNGAALPLSFFFPHLDTTLSLLSLHTSARTDFVTFWLPSFTRLASRGKQIGFRFLPQTEYEPSARLNVEPKPDIITRVFLLFRGVDENDAKEWKKVEEIDWVKEVGVEEEKDKDRGLFSVLEWGGMEVVG
ncbi:hypothetical protein JCM8547_006064 [Rhodosporidiobolus lusitaniae]